MRRFRMSDSGAFLATRPKGETVRRDLERSLAELPEGEALIIDFTDVEDVTFSFADETIAKLMVARSAGDMQDRGIALSGMNDDIRETVAIVLERRDVAAVVADPSPSIVGADSYLDETLQAALHLGSFRAADLADRLGLSPQATNNRLRHLLDAGAVVRHRIVPEGGGKEFQYQVVVPAHA